MELNHLLSYFQDLSLQQLWEVLRYNPSEPMIFSTGLFFLLFIGFLVPYMGIRNTSLRIIYVALFSLYFYYKSSGWSVLLLLFSTTSDYIIGRELGSSHVPADRKLWVSISVFINLGVLAYFKYFNMLGSLIYLGINELGFMVNRPDWITLEWSAWDIVLPVGISFYTFQTMSYIIDIYRREIKPLERWVDYLFYVSFFPQLVAGPIVRAKDFIPQIYKKPFLGREEYAEALLLITSGLIKKAIISDYISLNFVDRIFDAPTLYTGFENLMGIYGYALQIYCDFSGYSDMAIGIALILGFRFNVNFDSPYQSASITEFWRRWHISLSSWLRDYLYIPLGGNRKGRVRTYINLFLTMLLGGLWHGAAWRFVLWGAIHGLALGIHKLWISYFPSSALPAEQMPWWRRWLGRLVTFHLVCFAWIFFRADSMEVAGQMIQQIISNFHPEIALQFLAGYKFVVGLMLLGYLTHFIGKQSIQRVQNVLMRTPFVLQALLLVVVIFVLLQVRSSEIQPFIYFQF